MSKEVFYHGNSLFTQDTLNTNWKHFEFPTKPEASVLPYTFHTLNACSTPIQSPDGQEKSVKMKKHHMSTASKSSK